MYKPCLICGVILLIVTACSQKPSEQYFMTHLRSLRHTLIACQVGRIAQHSDRCQIAINAFKKLMVLEQSLMADPERFGQTILQDQIKFADLQSQIQFLEAQNHLKNKAQLNHLKKAAKNLFNQIQSKLTLVAVSEGMA